MGGYGIIGDDLNLGGTEVSLAVRTHLFYL